MFDPKGPGLLLGRLRHPNFSLGLRFCRGLTLRAGVVKCESTRDEGPRFGCKNIIQQYRKTTRIDLSKRELEKGTQGMS